MADITVIVACAAVIVAVVAVIAACAAELVACVAVIVADAAPSGDGVTVTAAARAII